MDKPPRRTYASRQSSQSSRREHRPSATGKNQSKFHPFYLNSCGTPRRHFRSLLRTEDEAIRRRWERSHNIRHFESQSEKTRAQSRQRYWRTTDHDRRDFCILHDQERLKVPRVDESDRRCRKRLRYENRSKRCENERSDSSGNFHIDHVNKVNRSGIVSDDDVELIKSPIMEKTKRKSCYSHDDSVGHFRGNSGDLIANRYKIIRDVGLGTFGRVVECIDLSQGKFSDKRRRPEPNCVAIKIVRNVKRYHDSAVIEGCILEAINRRGGRGISHCVVLHDCFTWKSHYCLVFENLGLSLYDYLKKHSYCGFPMVCIKDFARQLLETLEFLHSFGLIHTDLKPENILLTNCREVPYTYKGKTYMIPESTKVKVIDFGGATYDSERKSCVVNTRQYRAPEVILGLGWSMPSDLWSAACILVELYVGELLFATHDNLEHLALIQKIVAPFPPNVLSRAKNVSLVKIGFDSKGFHRMDRVLSPDSVSYVSSVKPLESIIRPEDGRFLDLIRRLLIVNPDDRASAQACSRHKF